ncbi:MAG: glycerate kinase [Marmoricola sp.]|nr:glycerate kinase [Marmoricola sp.]
MSIDHGELRADGHAGRSEFPTSNGLTHLRTTAVEILAAGLSAAMPDEGFLRSVELVDSTLYIGDRPFILDDYDRIWFVGAGKATALVAAAVSELLGSRLAGGLAVVQRGAAREIAGIEVLEADHPVPGQPSLAAGRRLMEFAEGVTDRDLVITSFTGGSSALVCLPPAGVTFDSKQQLHRLLLASGAPIEDINAVRKHVSAFKGGRFAAAMGASAIINLTIPDVTSGRPDCITDPTVPDLSTRADAIAVLVGRGLWDKVDPSIRAHLEGASAESPTLDDVDITTLMLTDGERACAAMSARAAEMGLTPYVFGTQITGEASTVGTLLAALACETASHGRPFAGPCALIAGGGETVVTLPSNFPGAEGGPNQETALAFAAALQAEPVSVAAVFIDSDGSDGGTRYAGAVVDSRTQARAVTLGLDLDDLLRRHESSRAFDHLGDLVVLGPTLTNISDLWVVVIGSLEGSP